MKSRSETKFIARVFVTLVAALGSLSAAITPVPDKVPCAVADRQAFTQPDQLHLTGWLGTRIDANEANRLAKLDVNRLLEGYRKRPGRQSWDGEHVGKWLHAATLAWVNTGDPALREKLDYTASELIKCQLEDGYLGTYLDKDRWTEWDAWAHKYNLIGLITYMRYTGNMAPLTTCRRMGDLLCNTFGDEPGKRDIIKAGEHVGLAPTSVLEPMVLLYRLTGEERYLDFCKYILRAWEQPDGPKTISTLLTLKRVDKVGDAKAYEMLSCLNGALEYYRTVGDPRILEACLNAWQDIVKNRLYITGAASYGEVFHDDYDLPNVANVGETCVTVTWEQFNAQLLRLTGEARFAEQLEHVVLNQLFGAQKCDGSAWGYYVQMEGKKPYSANLDGHCCLSSGPRGIALIPTFALSTDADGVVVNLYEAGTAKLSLKDHTPVSLVTETRYPADEQIRITVGLAGEKNFTIKLRMPAWCHSPSVEVKGQPVALAPGADGYVAVQRSWKEGDQIDLRFKLEPRVIVGDHKNGGKLAVLYGPLVLAAEADLLGDQLSSTRAVALPSADLAKLDVTPEPAPDNIRTWPGAEVFRVNAIPRHSSKPAQAGAPLSIRLIPFADAGNSGSEYRVWLPIGQTGGNLLLDEKESRSRQGNVSGSITDGDPGTFVVTYDGKAADEDWFAVTLAGPTELKRVVFVHGKTFHDGGWFDASAGPPQIQVQATAGGKWETVGVLKDYPATTATSAAGLTGGERFSCPFPADTRAYGVRVVGKPASGDNPEQAFASCADLLAE
ncbi:MAG: glycoside hydrolase family 127 protein [Limisphaerales bacterium]